MTVSLSSSSSAASRTIARACYEPIGTNIQSLAASQRGVGPFAAALSMCEELLPKVLVGRGRLVPWRPGVEPPPSVRSGELHRCTRLSQPAVIVVRDQYRSMPALRVLCRDHWCVHVEPLKDPPPPIPRE